MKTVRLLRPAEDEMLEAAFFYEQQSDGLGQDFLRKLQSAIEEIVEHPTRWPRIRSSIRRRMIHRFPYAVLYEDRPQEILIVAVMHLRRNPTYWIDRT